MIKKQQTILFDLDGTLIDSTEAILESFDHSFGFFGLGTPPDEKITAEIGHPLDKMFLSLGVSEEEIWEYVDVYKAYYRQISREKTYLLPGAHEALEKASETGRLGVVTTKTARFSIELLEHMDIMRYFEVLIGREDVTYPKPHPEPVLKAISKLEADRNGCWMVGDTCMDMLAAQAAGIKGVAVTSGYGSYEQLSACCPAVTKSALDAVASIIRS